MTFAELVEEVLENISLNVGGSHVQRGEVKRLLNLAQREVAWRTGIPQAVVSVPVTGFISGPFMLPTRFNAEGVMRAEIREGELLNGHEVRNLEVPILSPGELYESRRYRFWDSDEYCGPPILRFTAADPNAGFTPAGIERAKYRFVFQVVPVDMVRDDDEPFSVLDYCEDPPIRRPGAGSSFHRVLAHHVTYELLQRLQDERWQTYFARFQEMQQDMFASASPVSVFMPGRILRSERG